MDNRTTKPEFAPFIIDTLKHLRVTNRRELFDEVFDAMKHMLHPADLVILPNSEPRWRNQAQHMLDGLIEDGVVADINGEIRLTE